MNSESSYNNSSLAKKQVMALRCIDITCNYSTTIASSSPHNSSFPLFSFLALLLWFFQFSVNTLKPFLIETLKDGKTWKFHFIFLFMFCLSFLHLQPWKEHFISVFFSFADQATSNKNNGTLEYSPMLYLSLKVACVKMAIVSHSYEIPISWNEQALIQRSPFISNGMNYAIRRIENRDV